MGSPFLALRTPVGRLHADIRDFRARSPTSGRARSVETALPRSAGRAESRCSGAANLAAVFELVEGRSRIAQRGPVVRLAAALQLFDLRTQPDDIQPRDGIIDEGRDDVGCFGVLDSV